jgi:hypothetical protein
MAQSRSYRLAESSARYNSDRRTAAIGTVAWLLAVVVASAAWVYFRSSTGEPDSPNDAAAAQSVSATSLHGWLAESTGSINGLVNARNDIADAAAQHDLARIGVACRTATGAVANLDKRMPSPVSELNSALQHAIDSYEAGLPYCISASRTQDDAGMQQAATLITEGDAAMRHALDILGDPRGGGSSHLGVLIV